eukprot:TRINITY_DN15210_c0_g1_i4.p2 TRINITY_DN15210_c0_g1~~TRINITY_DN15210_c0_g1_i4.p2  ORF type:complete len:142 (+),score=39.31 TRINITY_DN15210_c0_g1_i4:128-553(+)
MSEVTPLLADDKDGEDVERGTSQPQDRPIVDIEEESDEEDSKRAGGLWIGSLATVKEAVQEKVQEVIEDKVQEIAEEGLQELVDGVVGNQGDGANGGNGPNIDDGLFSKFQIPYFLEDVTTVALPVLAGLVNIPQSHYYVE